MFHINCAFAAILSALFAYVGVGFERRYIRAIIAEKEKVDLIVVGTRGRSGFKKLLLGSVASGVVNYAHCPVLIVK